MDNTGRASLRVSVVVLWLCLTSVGCVTGLQAPGPLYQDEFLTVRLESNPAGAGQTIEGKGTRTLAAQQLSGILRGLSGRREFGLQPDPVFQDEELKLVSGELSKGLRMASPRERVAFELRRVREKGREVTSGAIYLRGDLLYVNLVQFRSSGSVRFDDAEYIEKPNFELLFEPADAVIPKDQGFASRWIGAGFPEVIVDIRKVSNGYASARARSAFVPRAESSEPVRPQQAPEGTIPPKTEPATITPTFPAPPAVTMEALQRQVKELTDSNQELRAKLKDLRDRQDRSQAVNEELTRLRQDLAEAKQFLADKVLELNRLKRKAGGTDGGKKK